MHLFLSPFSLMNPIIFKSHLSVHRFVCVCVRANSSFVKGTYRRDPDLIHMSTLSQEPGGLIEQWCLWDRDRMTWGWMRQKARERERDHEDESIKRARTRQIGAICKGIWKEKREVAREKGVNCSSEWNERQKKAGNKRIEEEMVK